MQLEKCFHEIWLFFWDLLSENTNTEKWISLMPFVVMQSNIKAKNSEYSSHIYVLKNK
jgi:hypothetical protein